jgi:hypothetical protein
MGLIIEVSDVIIKLYETESCGMLTWESLASYL